MSTRHRITVAEWRWLSFSPATLNHRFDNSIIPLDIHSVWVKSTRVFRPAMTRCAWHFHDTANEATWPWSIRKLSSTLINAHPRRFQPFLFLTARNTALINRNHKSIHSQLNLRKLNKEKKSHKPQRASPSRILLFNARRKFYFGSFISFMNFLCLQTMPRKRCLTERNSLSFVVDGFGAKTSMSLEGRSERW